MPNEGREITISLIRHYWQDGDNAVWRVGPGVPDIVIAGIKKDYALLSATRPTMASHGSWKVLLHYEEENDRYGRNATALAGAVVLANSSAAFEARVRAQLATAEREVLQLAVQQDAVPRAAPVGVNVDGAQKMRPPAGGQQKRKGGALAILLVAGVALVIGVAGSVWLFSGQLLPQGEGVARVPGVQDDSAKPKGQVASAFCADWSRIYSSLQARNGAPANCLTRDAIAVCGSPTPDSAPAFQDRVRRHTTGYCAIYSDLSLGEAKAAARQDLASMVSMNLLATLDAKDWGAALLGLEPADEAVVPQPLAEKPGHRQIGMPKAGVLGFPGLVIGGADNLQKAWNAALPSGLKGAHEAKDGVDMAATGAAYLTDYCEVVDALAKAHANAEQAGLPDPLVVGITERIAREQIDLAEGEGPCVRDGKPIEAKYPDALLPITRAADVRKGIVRLVTVVDFCTLVPDLAELRRQGVSPLVRDCRDVARVLGVDWR